MPALCAVAAGSGLLPAAGGVVEGALIGRTVRHVVRVRHPVGSAALVGAVAHAGSTRKVNIIPAW